MILKPRRSARYLYTEEGWKRETREERRGQSEESGEHKRRAQSSTASPEGSRETRRPRTTENKQSSMLCYSRVHSRDATHVLTRRCTIASSFLCQSLALASEFPSSWLQLLASRSPSTFTRASHHWPDHSPASKVPLFRTGWMMCLAGRNYGLGLFWEGKTNKRILGYPYDPHTQPNMNRAQSPPHHSRALAGPSTKASHQCLIDRHQSLMPVTDRSSHQSRPLMSSHQSLTDRSHRSHRSHRSTRPCPPSSEYLLLRCTRMYLLLRCTRRHQNL